MMTMIMMISPSPTMPASCLAQISSEAKTVQRPVSNMSMFQYHNKSTLQLTIGNINSSPIIHNLEFSRFWQFSQFLAFFFENFKILNFVVSFDNWDDLDNGNNSIDLWPLIHWLQFWHLRTWIHDNLSELTIKSDSICNSCDVFIGPRCLSMGSLLCNWVRHIVET